MCGISGIIQIRSKWNRQELTQKLEIMSRQVAHRGPDDQGVWVSPSSRLGFAHRRLSIVDLSSDGKQPMFSHDGRFVITFNGEIYNYKEIKQKLAAKGAKFVTQTDTEVLIESYRIYGRDCLQVFDGMFAFVLYDTEKDEIFAARDPFGEKPFYYAWVRGAFVFASELSAISCFPEFTRSTNRILLSKFLCLQYFDGEDTVYEHAYKLRPGHCFTLKQDGNFKIQQYFEFRPKGSELDCREEDLVDELESILTRNIERRLQADVAVGGFLSGGVDSAVVMALATKKLGVKIQTFTIGFEGWRGSEHEQAERVARYLGTHHTTQLLTSNDLKLFDLIVRKVDEPNADTSLLPTYFLSKLARQNVKVALSGDGADELFGGYGRYFATLAEENHGIRSQKLGERYYSNRILVFDEKEVINIVGEIPSEVRDFFQYLKEEVNRSDLSPIDCMRKTDVEHYLPGAVLSKVDRMSMRNGLEVRTPFLNLDIARFAEKLPPRLLANGQNGKILLKKLACRYLPEEWVNLPKKGFGLPPSNWGDGKLYDQVVADVAQTRDRSHFWMDQVKVRQWLKNCHAEKDSNTYKLWCFSHLKEFIKNQEVKPCKEHNHPIPWLMLSLSLAKCKRKTVVFTSVSPGSLIDTTSQCIRVFPLWDCFGGAEFDWLHKFSHVWELVCKQFGEKPEQVAFHGSSYEDIAAHKDFLLFQGVKKILFYEQHAWSQIYLKNWPPQFQGKSRTPPIFFDGNSNEFVDYNWCQSRSDLLEMTRNTFCLTPIPVESSFVPEREKLFSKDTPKRAVALLREIFLAINFRREENIHLCNLRKVLSKGKKRTDLKNNSKKIIFILPNLSPGGAERQACNLIIQLKRRGFEVKLFVLLATVGDGGHYAYLLEKEKIEIINVSNVHERINISEILQVLPQENLAILGHPSYFVRNQLLPVFTHIFNENPAMVVCLLDIANLAGGIAALLAGVPKVVISFRNINPTFFSFYQKWYYRYYQSLIPAPNLVLTGNSIFGNENYAKWLKISAGKINLLRNGIEFSRLNITSETEQAELRKQLSFGRDDPIMGGIFRLSLEKRPKLFIQVFMLVKQSLPNLKGFVLGSGPMRQELDSQLHDKGLKNSLKLLGVVEDISPYISMADVIVQTSNAEGTANSIIEAQYLKKPVVITSAGGASESLIDGETGYLVLSDQPEEIAELVINLIQDKGKSRQMGERGKVFVENTFSLSAAAAKIDEYYVHGNEIVEK